MKQILFTLFLFVIFFSTSTLSKAQFEDVLYPNEAQGYEFYKSGKLKELRYLVSTKDDVKRIFGENCEHGCDYDESWKVSFSYVNSGWSRTTTENGQPQRFEPSPVYVGKLSGITLYPKKRISFENVVFPEAIKCNRSNSEEARVRICMDSQILWYSLFDEDTKDGKHFKGDIINIHYLPPKEVDDKIFILVSN